MGSAIHPSCFWLADIGHAGLALGLQRVEVLLESFFRGFTGIDGAAYRCGSLRSWWFPALTHGPPPLPPPWYGRLKAADRKSVARLNLKREHPDQCAPVMRWAIAVKATIGLAVIVETAFGCSDDIGPALPVAHQPRAGAHRCPLLIWGDAAGLGKGLGQGPKAPLRGLGEPTVGLFLKPVGDAPDEQVAAEPPGRGYPVMAAPFAAQRRRM